MQRPTLNQPDYIQDEGILVKSRINQGANRELRSAAKLSRRYFGGGQEMTILLAHSPFPHSKAQALDVCHCLVEDVQDQLLWYAICDHDEDELSVQECCLVFRQL